MPHFMMTLKFAPPSVKALTANPSDRRKAAIEAMGAAGAKLKEYYFALGDTDAYVTYEAPDAVTAASLAMSVAASGSASAVATIALLTVEEAMEAMRKSGAIQGAYKPPSA